MPIPFIIAGVAVAAGAYGVKKGVDAKGDFDQAGSLNGHAKQIQGHAVKELETAKSATESSMEDLGKQKFQLYEERLIPFVKAFEKLQNVDFKEIDIDQEMKVAVDKADIKSIREATLQMTDVVAGGLTSLGAGGLAGLAAYGSVGVLASTAGGTAIAGLSGVAATNATLAWLGGGALSAGGFGMAGGTAVLGGIVAGPVLAIGGMMLASKAESAKHQAYENLALAEKNAEELKTAVIKVTAIQTAFDEVHQVLGNLDNVFIPILEGLENLVTHSRKDWPDKIDFTSLSKQDQVGIYIAAMLAKTMKNLVEFQVMTDKGEVSGQLGDILQTSQASTTEAQQKIPLQSSEHDFEQRTTDYHDQKKA